MVDDPSLMRRRGITLSSVVRVLFSVTPAVLLAGLLIYEGFLIHDARTALQQSLAEVKSKSAQLDKLQADLDGGRKEQAKLLAEKANLNAELDRLRSDVDANKPELVIAKIRSQLGGATPGMRADSLWRRGHDAYEAGNLVLAEKLYSAALEEQKTFAPALNGLGRIEADRHNPLAAERYYQRAVKADEHYAHARYNLAHLYFHTTKDYDKAEAFAKQTLDVDPDYAKARALLKEIAKVRAREQ